MFKFTQQSFSFRLTVYKGAGALFVSLHFYKNLFYLFVVNSFLVCQMNNGITDFFLVLHV